MPRPKSTRIPISRQIEDYVTTNPGATARELGEVFFLDPPHVHMNLKRLRLMGKLRVCADSPARPQRWEGGTDPALELADSLEGKPKRVITQKWTPSPIVPQSWFSALL
jgi:hypothetical protein